MAGIAGINLTDPQIDFILESQGLSSSSTYTTDDQVPIQTAIYKQIPLIIAGLKNITEGGYSISWNVGALNAWFKWLGDQLGLTESPGSVKDKSYRW